MIDLRKEIIAELTNATGLKVFSSYQEISGLVFPLLSFDMEVSDSERTLNHETVTYHVKLDITIYSDDATEILTNETIKTCLHGMGFTCTYESTLHKTHHWYKEFQFEAYVRKDGENYIIQ